MLRSARATRTGRERLLELLGLLDVVHDERVQEARAADLELGLDGTLGEQRLLDPRGLGVGTVGNRQEVLNIRDLTGLAGGQYAVRRTRRTPALRTILSVRDCVEGRILAAWARQRSRANCVHVIFCMLCT